jgi:hypothetical protein
MFMEVRLDEGTDGDNLQPLGVGGIDGRLRQRAGDMTASNRWRNLRVHQHQSRRTTLVRENGRLTLNGELELTRRAVVGDGRRYRLGTDMCSSHDGVRRSVARGKRLLERLVQFAVVRWRFFHARPSIPAVRRVTDER